MAKDINQNAHSENTPMWNCVEFVGVERGSDQVSMYEAMTTHFRYRIKGPEQTW